MKRVHRLLYPKRSSGAWAPFFAAAVLLITAMVAFATRPSEPDQQGSAASPPHMEAGLIPGTVQLKPFPVEPLQRFVCYCDSQAAFEKLAYLANMNVVFASDFQRHVISVNLTNVKLDEALVAVARQTKAFLKPMAANTFLVIPDTPRNRRAYVDHAEGSPYDRWLNEEVVYIISTDERVAFKNLTTDKEREKFIQQFWDRRNPNPGSAENKFKEEHYRRIAYANEHYASSMPGWKTDRGRIYIMYGPPDEIEDHGKPHPSMEWKYLHLKGVGDNVIMQFVDLKGNGEYHLQLPR